MDVIFVPGNYGKYVNVQKLICSQTYESGEIKQQIHCHSVCQHTIRMF
jgi:2-keto-3-deoxy-galactonokinase